MLLRLVVAVALLVGAVLSLRGAWADAAYREGLQYTEYPALDVPGRLESYERAARRDPSGFHYRLRAGQILAARAEQTSSGKRAPQDDAVDARDAARDLRARALDHVNAAVDSRPLDARARVELARLLAHQGDVDGALREAGRALALGPRHRRASGAALALVAALWRRTQQPGLLRLVLSQEAERRTWSRLPPVRELMQAFAGYGPGLASTLVWECGDDLALLRAAAGLIRRVDAAGAAQLEALAEQIEARPK